MPGRRSITGIRSWRRAIARLSSRFPAAWLVALVLSSGCGDRPRDLPGDVPFIEAFGASPASITPGFPATLTWSVRGADSITLDQGVGKVGGTRCSVTPSSTTRYTLTATNLLGRVSASAVVEVLPAEATGEPAPIPTDPPVIDSFDASPATLPVGASTRLSWIVRGAQTVVVEPGIPETADDFAVVTPEGTTTYTLTATNALGQARRSLTVTVKRWAAGPPMLSARSSFSAVELGRSIYVLGGSSTPPDAVTSRHDPSTSAERLDPAGHWTSIAPLPRPRSAHVGGAFAQELILAGGTDGTTGSDHFPTNLDTVETYWADTDLWTTAKIPPFQPRTGAASTMEGSVMYLLGGYRDGFYGGDVATSEAYDFSTEQFTTLPPLLKARSRLSATSVAGKIYAIGGVEHATTTEGTPVERACADVEEYDPNSRAWRRRAALRTGRYDAAAVAIDGKILLIGGESGSGTLGTVDEYDPITDTWTAREPMITPRSALSAVAVAGVVYAIGGVVADPVSHTRKPSPLVEVYQPLR